MLEWLLAQLYRNDDNLSMLTATLTGAVRENYDGLKMGMEHIRSIENIVTHGNVQASNARRNIVDGKQKLVTDMLRILLTRRRRCRLREIHTLARSILDLVKASTDVYEAMVATDFTTALVLSDYARLSLEKPNLSKFVVSISSSLSPTAHPSTRRIRCRSFSISPVLCLAKRRSRRWPGVS